MHLIDELLKKKLIQPPHFLANNLHYLTIMGSVSYGVSSDTSDMDLYGFCIPTKEMIFPHLAGIVPGFGDQGTPFNQYQQHHVLDKDAMAGKGRSYDLSIYNIVRYFQLCMDGNPNMVDSLFTDTNCVLHITQVGQMVKENRHLFLSKKSWHTYKGYAYSQVHKMATKDHKGFDELVKFEQDHNLSHKIKFDEVAKEYTDRENGQESHPGMGHLTGQEVADYYALYQTMMNSSKRAERVKIDGFDVKFAYHVVRLLDEAEQIMVDHDIDLMRNREQLKSIRRGEWTEEQIRDHFTEREKQLTKVYNESKLRNKPNEPALKKLLLQCLEAHYGSLDKCIVQVDKHEGALREIRGVLDKLGM